MKRGQQLRSELLHHATLRHMLDLDEKRTATPGLPTVAPAMRR